MIRKTERALIIAEILGFLIIMTGIIGLLTGSAVLRKVFLVLFFMLIAVAAVFLIFATMAVREVKVTGKKDSKKKKKKKK